MGVRNLECSPLHYLRLFWEKMQDLETHPSDQLRWLRLHAGELILPILVRHWSLRNKIKGKGGEGTLHPLPRDERKTTKRATPCQDANNYCCGFSKVIARFVPLSIQKRQRRLAFSEHGSGGRLQHERGPSIAIHQRYKHTILCVCGGGGSNHSIAVPPRIWFIAGIGSPLAIIPDGIREQGHQFGRIKKRDLFVENAPYNDIRKCVRIVYFFFNGQT